jgi:hypothetical protein
MIEEKSRARGSPTGFFVILTSFVTIYLLSWPVLFSFYLWVFADRSSFLNLDYLLAQHLRLGVDAFYSYGLLPVLIQHVLFAIFGRGYWPMIGCTAVVTVLIAVFWSRFIQSISSQWIYLAAVVAVCPIAIGGINPNFPYSMVQLSMLFALLLLVQGRPEIALAISTIGCFSVPSLPLLLTGLVGLYIVVDWYTCTDRTFSLLARRLAPGVFTYLLLGTVLSAFFGLSSTLATALPLNGVQYYQSRGGGLIDLMGFLHPAGHSLKFYFAYYILSLATWWILTTIGLILFAAMGAGAMIRNRRLDPRHVAVLFCAILQVFFICFAYRNEDQHVIYDPILASGVLLGISLLRFERWRNLFLLALICFGFTGQAARARQTLIAWRTTHPSPLTANLYAEPEYGPELSKIVAIAATHNVLMMSYATGVHHYYPSLHSTNSWFLVSGLMLPADRERILANMRMADVVVEDTAHFPWFIDRDADVQSELQSMCLTDVTRDFQTWWRHPPESATCKVNMRNTGSATESPTSPN